MVFLQKTHFFAGRLRKLIKAFLKNVQNAPVLKTDSNLKTFLNFVVHFSYTPNNLIRIV